LRAFGEKGEERMSGDWLAEFVTTCAALVTIVLAAALFLHFFFGPRADGDDDPYRFVPDGAVLKGANRIGYALVWYYISNGQLFIRCFLLGSGA
jgi:hypothetical protein